MNLNPQAFRILCYGDSNTRGSIPGVEPGPGSRYAVNVRWPGVVQEILGQDFEVIEEGLGGRTTRFEDMKREGRNGMLYLGPCLESHNPLDAVVLSLGTNDFKERFNQSPEDIAVSIRLLVGIIRKNAWNKDGAPPKIVLLVPPLPDGSVVEEQFKGFLPKFPELREGYGKVAKEEGCEVIDFSQLVESSKKDGLHLEPKAHRKIGEAVAEAIREQLNK